MSTGPLGAVLRHIRSLAYDPKISGQTDGALLRAFLGRNDQAAFEALVRRHGPMVLRVCRRTLDNVHDAEDALQATFLVLARQGASIRKRESLASWLHGVAYRMATHAKRAAARRHKHELRVSPTQPPDPAISAAWQELQALLDAEIASLPESLRAPFVYCCLETKSCAEAAQQLGLQESTVRMRLSRARKLLQERLTRRGLSLATVLAAVAIGTNDALAAVPRVLAVSTAQAASQMVAGQALGAVSAKVITLMEGVNKAMLLTKCKMAILLLACTAIVGTGLGFAALRCVSAESPLAQEAPQKAARQGAKEKRPHPTDRLTQAQTKDIVKIHGVVLDPDGKPVPGAKLYLWTNTSKKLADLPIRAKAAEDGSFGFPVTRAELEQQAKVLANAKGFGPDWIDIAPAPKGELAVRLAKDDVPVNGRVLDLEARPISGVTVEVGGLEQGDVKGWIEGRKQNRSSPDLKQLSPGALEVPTTVTTGKDGRFRLTGFGRERIVMLRLRGDDIEHCTFWVVTVDDPLTGMRVGPFGTYGASFTHLARPSKPIIGTVRDKATGKPVAGISIWSSYYNNRFAKTDENGRYRIVGAGKYEKYSVSAGGAPYFNSTKMDIADTPGLEPITVDFELERGIAVKGRLLDKSTGKPVRGYVSYVPLADNPNLKDFSEIGKLQAIASNEGSTTADGSFTVTAIPGKGLLLAKAYDDRFLAGEIGDFKPATGIILQAYHAVILIDPSDKDPKSTNRDITLEPGATVTGTVLGPDEQPLAGARVAGLTAIPEFFNTSGEQMKTASFKAEGLSPRKPRALVFIHPEKKLAKVQQLRGDEADPVKVHLEPLGVLTGHILDADGKPLAGLTATALMSNNLDDHKSLPQELLFNYPSWSKLTNGETTTDQDGKFRIEGLVPGLKYILNVKKGTEFLHVTREGLTVESGQAKDLGDLKDKPAAEKERKEQP